MQSSEAPPSGRADQRDEASQPPTFISVKDTAQSLGVSLVTVYRRYHAGQFPGRRFGRSIQILRAFVDDLLAEIRSGRQVDVDEFAAGWVAREAVAS